MIIYNVTINIDDSVHEQWLQWMTEEHIPQVMQTGKFIKANFVKVMVVEETGNTYSVQYYAEDQQKLREYYQEHAPALRQEGIKRFGDKMLAFRTELELLKEF